MVFIIQRVNLNANFISIIEKTFTAAPFCTGLKTDWTRTMETTAQFPVDTGAAVEVRCSYSDALQKGSSEVTCLSGIGFTFSDEPSCTIAGA